MARSEVAPLACSSAIIGARSAARAAAASALASAPFWRAFAVSLAPIVVAKVDRLIAQFEFTLAAIAQNLRRLAKLVARPPPIAPAPCVA